MRGVEHGPLTMPPTLASPGRWMRLLRSLRRSALGMTAICQHRRCKGTMESSARGVTCVKEEQCQLRSVVSHPRGSDNGMLCCGTSRRPGKQLSHRRLPLQTAMDVASTACSALRRLRKSSPAPPLCILACQL